MTKYVAFLRGINVGGNKIIKMEALREILTMPGFKKVTTYIQSGNVLFETKETDQAVIIEKIEKRLLKQLGYEVKIFLRSIDEIAAVIDNDPFKSTAADEVLYIFFLANKVTKEKADLLVSLNTGTEQYRVSGREAFCLCRKVNGSTNFSNVFVEKKLGVPASARNITTVKKILALGTAL